nr:SOS response-associated peptidase family protein [Pantoea stewartii]
MITYYSTKPFHCSRQPLFFAAIGKAPFGQDHGHEGFVIVTAQSNKGMVDIHDRLSLVMQPDSVREWLSEDTSSARASETAHKCALPESDFDWHKIDNAVGNIHNQGKVLTEPI